MATLPRLNSDWFFGDTAKPEPDWRKDDDEDEDDDEDPEPVDPDVLKAMLGFTPSDDDD